MKIKTLSQSYKESAKACAETYFYKNERDFFLTKEWKDFSNKREDLVREVFSQFLNINIIKFKVFQGLLYIGEINNVDIFDFKVGTTMNWSRVADDGKKSALFEIQIKEEELKKIIQLFTLATGPFYNFEVSYSRYDLQ